MKILCCYDSSGPKYHRCLLPAHGLEQLGYEVKVVQKVTEQDCTDIDIILFNRLIPGADLKDVIEWREKYGFKLVCDLDDDWILGPDHILYQTYKQYGISQKIHDHVVLSDMVTVTHERLYERVKPFNENCHIFPNAIPKIAQFLTEKVPSELTRLFWAGGITHKKDLELLRRPLQLIKRDKCKLVICGYEEGNPEWKEMAKIYTTDSAYNTIVFKSLKVHEYYKTYAHCDISLIPLVENDFNRNKSNLKILEAANIGSPVIVSRVHPYLDFPENIVNYVDSHRPWYFQINKLLKDPEMIRGQGYALQAYCDKHYNFEKISEERKQLFDQYGKQQTITGINETAQVHSGV